MHPPKKPDTTQDDEERAKELAERALAIIHEGLQGSTVVRKRVLAILVSELKREEIRTLVGDIGWRDVIRVLNSR